MRAEIWLGGKHNVAYSIDNVKKIDYSPEGVLCKITDEDGWSFETSTSNVVIIRQPKEKGGEGYGTIY